MFVPAYKLYLHLAYLPFIFALGAVVGSFLNVVILRVPAGQNIISPPSHCPKCKHRLRWHENLPIVGWILVRGRCRECKKPISIQYPLIELAVAVLFAAIYVEYYMIDPAAPVLGAMVPDWLSNHGIGSTWPWLMLHYILITALLAMMIIDLRTYMIPIELTWAVTIPAVVVHAVWPIWPGGRMYTPLSSVGIGEWAIPLVNPAMLGASIGGMLGVVIGVYLLRRNILRHSFLDFDLYIREGDKITDYPHPRRELEWEVDFLAPVMLGLVLGWWIGDGYSQTSLPLWAAALGGSFTGYLVGAGIIWLIRILATAALGKEALGLGDAHLLGCVGAVLGWVDPILVFLFAPFLVISCMVVGSVLGRFFKGFQRVVPFGPGLALATLVVMFADEPIDQLLTFLFNRPIDLP